MIKLPMRYAALRAFSLATQHVRTPPINLEVSMVDGSRGDNSHLEEFYKNTFLKEEPMVRAAGVTDLKDLQAFVSKALQNQHSVLLRERSSGEVVAAASGGPITVSTQDHLRQYADQSMTDPRSRRLLHLWASVLTRARLHDLLHLNTVWDVSFLATAPRMRRLGLAQFVVTQQRRLATRLGHGALSLYSACPHTARLAAKLGCRGLGARPLADYKDGETPWVEGDASVEVFYCVLQHLGAPGSGGASQSSTQPRLTQ